MCWLLGIGKQQKNVVDVGWFVIAVGFCVMLCSTTQPQQHATKHASKMLRLMFIHFYTHTLS